MKFLELPETSKKKKITKKWAKKKREKEISSSNKLNEARLHIILCTQFWVTNGFSFTQLNSFVCLLEVHQKVCTTRSLARSHQKIWPYQVKMCSNPWVFDLAAVNEQIFGVVFRWLPYILSFNKFSIRANMLVGRLISMETDFFSVSTFRALHY